MGVFTILFRYMIWFALLFAGVSYWLEHKQFIFNKKVSTSVKSASARGPVSDRFTTLHKDLRSTFGFHILSEDHQIWHPTLLFGTPVHLSLLHTSLTEMLVGVGSNGPTTGYCGRHFANTTVMVMAGQFDVQKAGELTTSAFKQGEVFKFLMGDSCTYSTQPGTYAVVYARGFTPFTAAQYVTGALAGGDLFGLFRIVEAASKTTLIEVAAFSQDFYTRTVQPVVSKYTG